jgi:hypothetical protein
MGCPWATINEGAALLGALGGGREVAVVTLKNRFYVTEAEVIGKHWAP